MTDITLPREIAERGLQALEQMYKRAASVETQEASDQYLQNLADNPMSGEIALEAQEVLFIRGAIDALRERLAQPEPDWDWRHPKAQSLIGAKARLEIKLRLIEQLLEDPNFETTASDMEYWEPMHDKLQKRLALPEQQPAAKVELMTSGGNAGLATRIVEIDDHLRERLRPGQLLYTAPQPRQWRELTDEQADSIIDGLRTCLHLDSKRMFLKTWLRDWAAHGIKGDTNAN